jgi:hypothetical protein
MKYKTNYRRGDDPSVRNGKWILFAYKKQDKVMGLIFVALRRLRNSSYLDLLCYGTLYSVPRSPAYIFISP